MGSPSLTVGLKKIKHNAEVVATRCKSAGIEVVGVTKGVLGSPEIAQAMLDGGIKTIGDSRLLNLKRLKEANLSCPLVMLRQPMKDEVEDVVEVADVSLISEVQAALWLARASKAWKKKHKLILMVETGDLREGILPHLVLERAKEIVKLESIELEGVGTNIACSSRSFPTLEKLKLLVEVAEEVENKLNLDLKVISGGNSSAWRFVEGGAVPQRVNQLRIGEGVLLGQETVGYDPIPGASGDAFLLSAEIIEISNKPTYDFDSFSSFGVGKAGRRKQAVVALGRQDVGEGALKPTRMGIRVISISSDHLVLDIEECKEPLEVGDAMSFIPSYFALLSAFTSPYVEKKIA